MTIDESAGPPPELPEGETRGQGVQIFPYNGGKEVRVFVDSEGETWFVAADVCENLEVENSRGAIQRLDDEEKGVRTVDTLGGPQSMSVVNEAGLYSLIFTSRKESAKKFSRWVRHEVLPALRRHGAYVMTERPVTLQQLLRLAADEIDKGKREVLRVEQAVAEKEAALADAAPKAAYYDRALASKSGTMSVGDTAKLLGTGQIRLFGFLREIGWLQTDNFHGKISYPPYGHHNVPYQRVVEAGYVVCKERTFTRREGDEYGREREEELTTIKVMITPAGRRKLAQIMDEYQRAHDGKV